MQAVRQAEVAHQSAAYQMNNFDVAIAFVLQQEGGYTWDSRDPGGETNFGISKKAYPDLDIKNMTRDDAIQHYRLEYWIPVRGDQVPWPLCLYLFDCAVLQGVQRAVLLLQQTLNIQIDGEFGPETLNRAQRTTPDERALFLSARARVMTSYSDFDRFGTGWLKRLFLLAMQ